MGKRREPSPVRPFDVVPRGEVRLAQERFATFRNERGLSVKPAAVIGSIAVVAPEELAEAKGSEVAELATNVATDEPASTEQA